MRIAKVGEGAAGRPRWTAKVAAWLGLGASPGALLLGAGLGERHDGAVPVVAMLVGVAAAAALLWFQGLLGLPAPDGEDGALTDVARSYFTPAGQRVLGATLALGMVGWFGFNVGLGGAALGALIGVGWVGPLLLGVPCVVVAAGGLRRWNAVGTVATVAGLLLVGLVALRLAAAPTVTTGLDAPVVLLADVSTYLGFVAVFGVRAPDFSAHLASRTDLARCVAALCVPVAVVSLAGIALQAGTGTADLITVLAGPDGSVTGQLLVAAAVVAPTFTTLHSGPLALRAALGTSLRVGMAAIAVPGLALALARFDLQLVGWLSLLGAVLPPLVVAIGVESTARRRGRPPRLVEAWAWLPAAAAAVALTAAGWPPAPVVGVTLAALAAVLRRHRAVR